MRAQLLQSGQGHGRSRLAAQPFSAQFCFGNRDLGLGHVQAPSAAFLNHPRSLAPGGRVADANGGGARVRLHRLQRFAVAVSKLLHQWIGSFGLDDGDARQPRHQSQLAQLAKSLS